VLPFEVEMFSGTITPSFEQLPNIIIARNVRILEIVFIIKAS